MNRKYGILDRMSLKIIKIVDSFEIARQIIEKFNRDEKVKRIKRVIIVRM